MIRLFFIFIFSFSILNAQSFILTKEEKDWIRKHKAIKIGIDSNFAPFEFIDKKGAFKGITADYLKEMKRIINRTLDKNSQIEFDIIKNKTWNEIINMTKAKNIDMLSCIVETPQRSEYLDYTSVYLSFPMVIVTNKEIGFINNIEELKGRSVAVIDNYTPHEILSKYKDIFLVKTEDVTQALELVATGKTFAHVGNLSRVSYLLKEKGFQNLAISGITNYKYDFSMGVKKGDYVLKNIIQKSFDSIPQEIKTSIYYKWFPLDFKEKENQDLLWKILLGTLFITLVLSFWVFKLNINIKRKTIDKEELLEDKNWLNDSLKTAGICAWQWDLEQNQIKINPSFTTLLNLGEEETIISVKYFKSLIEKEDFSTLLTKMEKHFGNKDKAFSSTLRIETEAKYKKKIKFIGGIDKVNIFNHPKSIIGIAKEIQKD